MCDALEGSLLHIIQNVDIVAENIMDMLSPSSVSSLLCACRLPIDSRTRKKYLNVYRELPGCKQVLNELKDSGYRIVFASTHLDEFRSKIHCPSKFWNEYPQGHQIKLLVIVAPTAANIRAAIRESRDWRMCLTENVIKLHVKDTAEYVIDFVIAASIEWLPGSLTRLGDVCFITQHIQHTGLAFAHLSSMRDAPKILYAHVGEDLGTSRVPKTRVTSLSVTPARSHAFQWQDCDWYVLTVKCLGMVEQAPAALCMITLDINFSDRTE